MPESSRGNAGFAKRQHELALFPAHRWWDFAESVKLGFEPSDVEPEAVSFVDGGDA
jgi:hypothetical protein